MSLTELLCLGVRGQAQENESASLPNTERTEELGRATSAGRGRAKAKCKVRGVIYTTR